MNYDVKVKHIGTASVDAKDPSDAALKAVVELEQHRITDAFGDYECRVERHADAWDVTVRVKVAVGPAVPVPMFSEVAL